MLKVICLIIPLVLVASISAEVYDDEGKVITEEEINKEIDKMDNHPGRSSLIAGCVSGGCVGCVSFGVIMWFRILEDLGSENSVPDAAFFISMGVVVTIISIGGYVASQRDTNYAIERIKEQRRTQKKNNNESRGTDTRITLPLLSGSF